MYHNCDLGKACRYCAEVNAIFNEPRELILEKGLLINRLRSGNGDEVAIPTSCAPCRSLLLYYFGGHDLSLKFCATDIPEKVWSTSLSELTPLNFRERIYPLKEENIPIDVRNLSQKLARFHKLNPKEREIVGGFFKGKFKFFSPTIIRRGTDVIPISGMMHLCYYAAKQKTFPDFVISSHPLREPNTAYYAGPQPNSLQCLLDLEESFKTQITLYIQNNFQYFKKPFLIMANLKESLPGLKGVVSRGRDPVQIQADNHDFIRFSSASIIGPWFSMPQATEETSLFLVKEHFYREKYSSTAPHSLPLL